VSGEFVGEYERREICGQVQRILRDLGNPEPPLNVADVLELLSLDLQYYRSTDPGLITELTHRFNVLARKSIPGLGRQLVSALAKSKLCAFWVPDSARILLDQAVPQAKHRWIKAHEITHSITPWHRDFLLGDASQTLDPACHAILEAEANYGAGRLLFLQDRFARDARDLPLDFDLIKQLSGRYANSIVSTFWRTVEERNPNHAVFGLISMHPHHDDIGSHDGPDPWRYFIRSLQFRNQFANIAPADVFGVVARHATHHRTGPILLADDVLRDSTGRIFEFRVESFSNKYALLTIGSLLRERVPAVAVA
jgi:hypothetical protein